MEEFLKIFFVVAIVSIFAYGMTKLYNTWIVRAGVPKSKLANKYLETLKPPGVYVYIYFILLGLVTFLVYSYYT